MYNSAEVAERIKLYAKSKRIAVNDVLTASGLAKNTLVNMRAGSMPKADNLAKIAEQLDCSVDYLLGLTDIPTPIDKINPLTERQGETILHMTLKDSGLIGPDGQFTPEGAEVVARFITSNAEMLRKLINEK